MKVGDLIGKGLVSCVTDWKVSKPQVDRDGRRPHRQQRHAVRRRATTPSWRRWSPPARWSITAKPAGTWDPPTALTEFQQAYTANPSTNAVLVPNDENAAPIISYLKSQHVKPNTFPVTGQDATLVGLQNILSGYQCGTAYKPIYLEAQAAAALAIFLNAGQTPPAALVNGTVKDTTTNASVPSVLETPEWVTTANMNDTVIADGFVPASQLCTEAYKSACTAAGIS